MTIRKPGVTICEYSMPGRGQPSDESGHCWASTWSTRSWSLPTPRYVAASWRAASTAGCASGLAFEPGRVPVTDEADGSGAFEVEVEVGGAGTGVGAPAF